MYIEGEAFNEYKGFLFEHEHSWVVITGYIGKESDIVIPDAIMGKPVKTIRDDAFRGFKTLTSVKIPESVDYLGEHAFCNCVSLKEVYIGNPKLNIYNEIGYFRGEEWIPTPEASQFLACESLEKIEYKDGRTLTVEEIKKCTEESSEY